MPYDPTTSTLLEGFTLNVCVVAVAAENKSKTLACSFGEDERRYLSQSYAENHFIYKQDFFPLKMSLTPGFCTLC